MSTTMDLKTVRLTTRQTSAIRRRARELGISLEQYLRQLVDNDLAVSDKAKSTPLEELAAPFREALAGVGEEELDRRVKAAKAARRNGTSRKRHQP